MGDLENSTEHVSVLLNEVMEFLETKNLDKPALFLDCTLGGAGHTRAMLEKDTKLRAVGLDQDLHALERAKGVLKNYSERVCFLHGNFRNLAMILSNNKIQFRKTGVENESSQLPVFDRILLDLGISSDQLNDPERGFSFKNDGPLDMRMSKDITETAADILNTSEPRALKRIFLEGGLSLREASILTSEILSSRPFERTQEFASVCRIAMQKASRSKKKKSASADLATVPFQAVRIAVNQEYQSLKDFLEFAPKISAAKTRLGVISFHSLEDKIVTKTFRAWERGPDLPNRLPAPLGSKLSLGKLLTKHAVFPSEEEIETNPRSRSARFRCFEFAEAV